MPKMTKKTKEIAFMAGFAAYLAVLYFSSAKLASASKAFPFAIICLSLVVIVLKVLTYRFPKLKFLDPSGEMGKKRKVETDVDSDVRNEEPVVNDEKMQRSRLLTVALFLIWLATFPAGIYLFGFLPALFLWLLVFLVGLSRLKLQFALILGVATFSALYAMFGLLLKLNFGKGILF